MGVSVENVKFVHRIDDLRLTGAHVKFLSLEPLLGPLPRLALDGIDWVIVGGESGPGVAFFFKQWGGVFKSRTGRSIDGRTWDELPARVGAEAPAGRFMPLVEHRA